MNGGKANTHTVTNFTALTVGQRWMVTMEEKIEQMLCNQACIMSALSVVINKAEGRNAGEVTHNILVCIKRTSALLGVDIEEAP